MPVNTKLYQSVVPIKKDNTTVYTKDKIEPLLNKNFYTSPIKERSDFKGNLLSGFANHLSKTNNPIGKEINPAGGKSRGKDYGNMYDLYNYYFGQPLESKTLMYSQYKPTVSKEKNNNYISINDDKFKDQVLDIYNNLDYDEQEKKSIPVSGYASSYNGMNPMGVWLGQYDKNKLNEALEHRNKTNAIGNFIIGKSSDEKGDYISYYDKFDIASGNENVETFGTAKPYEIYDRIYVKKDSNGKYIRQ